MAIGGVAELLFGVRAEQEGLENIAKPLTAEEAEEEGEGEGEEGEERGEGEPRKRKPEEHERPPEERREPARQRYRRRPSSPGMPVFGPYEEQGLEREVETIERALEEHGEATRRELRRRVGARYWGPGRFHAALRQATAERRVKRLRRDHYAPS